MARDPRHDILFQPLQIGPVTAKNRFYQVPHCTGMGWRRPKALAAMRGMKAEGGWAVVNTEYCSVDPTSDNDGHNNTTLWNTSDIRAHHAMTSAVHAHGALAGVELWLGGGSIANLGTRLPPMGLRNRPQPWSNDMNPVQSRVIDKQDIRNIRKWHRDAAKRALQAEFDIVYVYATHGYLLSQFMDPATNTRSDEYGGSLENRTRLVRELIEETAEIVQGRAAVATRFSVDLNDTETYDAFAMLAHLPDLWDLTIPDYSIEMGVSRFVKEASFTDSIAKAKVLTSKPVVAVGRYTSPDTMAAVLRAGGQDMIGAARPSIADPYLPRKIEEGRIEDIRECIGCNICYAQDALAVPIRCTQNPSMGEEWRLGWHPEHPARTNGADNILVVGAGPAGLEAARAMGAQGHQVLLAEARRDLGGRVAQEARLPGLSEWARVRDWRVGQIDKMDNVQVFRESALTAQDVRDLDVAHVLIATGADWAKDGVGRHSLTPLQTTDNARTISAESILRGDPLAGGSVLIYDDDHYYMGSVLALELRKRGHAVVLVTPAGRAAHWCQYTAEQYQTIAALKLAGVEMVTDHAITSVTQNNATATCVFTGTPTQIACDMVLPLTRRLPRAGLYDDLQDAGLTTLRRIGDAEAPSTIAAAVHSGHRAAMAFGVDIDPVATYGRREHPNPFNEAL